MTNLIQAAQNDAALADRNGWAVDVIDTNALQFRRGNATIEAFYSGASNGVYAGFIQTDQLITSLGTRRNDTTPRQLVQDALAS